MRKFLIGLLLLLLVLYGGLGAFLSSGKTLGARHEDFPEADFDYGNSSFADYIEYSRTRLIAARVDGTDAAIIENLLPFELVPPAYCPQTRSGKAGQGVVLIHGLLDAPYSMKDFGEFLQSQCFYVLGLLLPDHGSRPGDFLSTHWEEWGQATQFAAQELAEKADSIIMAGHSVGGALAILEGSRNSNVDALLLFAPALAITPSAKFARYITPLGHVFPKAAWVEVRADVARYRYESLSFTAAEETWDLIQAVLASENTRVQSLPVFTVASLQDNTVGTPAILAFMQRNTNAASHTLLYSQHTYPAAERMTVAPSSTPAQGVLSVSHLGLMTPPSHPWYGRDGQYRSCGHYGAEDTPDFLRCKNGERAYYGEATPENLQQGLIERISFNPYYDAMLAEVLRFLK